MKTVTLSVFIDALGWRIQDRHDFLGDLLEVKQPLETVFGYSSTCAPTILTGVAPREHGHFAFYRYAPEGGSFPRFMQWFRALPQWLVDRGRVRSWISKKVQRRLGWDGYFQLYGMPFAYLNKLDYSEKRDLFAPGGINGGQPTVFDMLREENRKIWVSDWRSNERDSLAALREQITEGEIEFAYLYWAELDGILHEHGTASELATERIRWYEQQLRELVAQAREVYDEVQLLVFSDHGMADIHHLSGLLADVEALGFKWGRDYASVFDATVARFWFNNEQAQRAIEELLEADPNGRVLPREELIELGCDFPNDSYGELYYLVNPGVLLCPSHMGNSPLAAMHGYHPNDPDSPAMFGALRQPQSMPNGLIDLCRTMRAEVERWAA